jgi:hypothetical protein
MHLESNRPAKDGQVEVSGDIESMTLLMISPGPDKSSAKALCELSANAKAPLYHDHLRLHIENGPQFGRMNSCDP